MAYLRRGLITSRTPAKNIHTMNAPVVKAIVTKPTQNLSWAGTIRNNANTLKSSIAEADSASLEMARQLKTDKPPRMAMFKVTDVIRLALSKHETNIVKLTCGHYVHSQSTYQGYCTKCEATHTKEMHELEEMY